MEEAMAWRVDPDTLHVAEADDGDWKVLREGAPTAESLHESKYRALDAARDLAQRGSAEQIKIHTPDGQLDRTVTIEDR
jgi:hypothetical protein